MNKIKKILAPTDLSELSQVGVRYALELAKGVGAEVTAYHVVTYNEISEYHGEVEQRVFASYDLHAPNQLLERSKHALSQFLKDHFSDLISSVKLREKTELGHADKNIVQEAETEKSDLIVISTHGRTGFSHVLMGSVTEKVVRQAPCPVLSIRPPKEQQETREAAGIS
ncbi:MAG: universal stress protein [Candidatus Binatia bacterium]